MPAQTIRTFIALELENNTKDFITNIQNKLKESDSLKAKWIESNNLHLTLKFLGDTHKETLDQIKDRLNNSLKKNKPFKCNLSEIGTFPNERFIKVLWIGIDQGKDKLKNLSNIINDELYKLGFKKEEKEFKTHITICRPKQILDQDNLQKTFQEINKSFKPLEFTASRITLFESQLSPQGPTYFSLFSYNLV